MIVNSTTFLFNKNLYSQRNIASKGYVNGKYFDDKIIQTAKYALKNPGWEEELRNKHNHWKGYLNWHECIEEQGGMVTRGLMGLFTFGTSELLVGGICALGALLDNEDVDDTISKVKECIKNLLSNK